MLSTGTVGALAGLFVAVFALTFLVLLFRLYRKKRKHKLPDSENEVQQPHSSETVNNLYTDMMHAPGTNRTQNDVVLTTTTNGVRNDMMLVSGTNRNQNDDVLTTTTTTSVVRNDDIYVENEEGEYDHLHSSRPKQVVSEMEDERFATSTELENASYSTVGKIRNSVPDCDNEYDSMAASLDNNFRSVANSGYEFCYQSRQRKDC
ncbi:uncharacterized protein LOC128185088 [Crassostrea angulata]|uniref:uncharacterized protein LOC128185088 n=1 Tax=Magallana angulata TaxID=2784310 RepID=UPI0022B1625A|nr:uncharacterized protein LOC128185088 [Crassostrea angulata]